MGNRDAGKKICLFLEKKLALFSQYQSITMRMKETVINNEEAKVAEFVDKRQDCINQIDKMDRSIKKTITECGNPFQNVCSKFRGTMNGYLQHIKAIMESVSLLDREVLVLVAERKETAQTELLRRQNMRKAVNGYTNGVGGYARFLDTKK